MNDARDKAEVIIKKYEGCILHTNQDIVGKWQIGWGCRFLLDGSAVTNQTPPVSQLEADSLFDHWLDHFMASVEGLVTTEDGGNNVIAALTSFAYNEGLYALGGSTLLRLLNAGHKRLAADQFDLWVYADGKKFLGLQRRRAEEKALFLTDDNVAWSGHVS